MRTCSVEGCENKHYGLGYCQKHYRQYKIYGHILERTIYDSNEVIDCGDYAEIVLYNKQGEEVGRALIDSEYVDLITKHKWYLNSRGYVENKKIGKLHRFIMKPSEDMVIDHINRNPLDNRRCNLRVCTQQQNILNKSMHSNNTSGVPGVSWDKSRNKWHAYIQIDGKFKSLGRFKTIEEAMEVRRQAEIEYFGEFAPNN